MKKYMQQVCIALLVAVFFFAGNVQAATQEKLPSFGMEELETLLKNNKGKVIMLNFFASWCPPCREEVPHLVELREQFPEDKVIFLGISLDEDRNALKKFMDANKINYPVHISKTDIQQHFSIRSIPFNILYDTKGEIAVNAPGVAPKAVIEQTIESLLEGSN